MSEHDCTCNDWRSHLYEYLDAELESAEAARLRLHAEHCPDCTDAEEAERHVRDIIRRCCTEQAPESLRMRVMSQIIVMRQSVTVYRTTES